MLIVLFAGFIGWTVWLSGWFSLDDVQVTGISDAVVDDVREYLSGAIGENLLFMDVDDYAAGIADSLPWLKDVVVQRELPHGLRVSVGEREPLGVWCRPLSRDGECYFFDHDRVWGSAVPSRGTLLITVMDEHPEGSPYPELVDDILMLSERLRSLDLRVSRVTLPAGPLDELHMDTTDGYPVLFSRKTPLQEQLDVLEVFLSDRRADGEFDPLYIDVRVPGKVYFKTP